MQCEVCEEKIATKECTCCNRDVCADCGDVRAERRLGDVAEYCSDCFADYVSETIRLRITNDPIEVEAHIDYLLACRNGCEGTVDADAIFAAAFANREQAATAFANLKEAPTQKLNFIKEGF